MFLRAISSLNFFKTALILKFVQIYLADLIAEVRFINSVCKDIAEGVSDDQGYSLFPAAVDKSEGDILFQSAGSNQDQQPRLSISVRRDSFKRAKHVSTRIPKKDLR